MVHLSFKNSEILKDILEVAAAIINIKENKQTIEGNNKAREWYFFPP